jgi:hypothetical protein
VRWFPTLFQEANRAFLGGVLSTTVKLSSKTSERASDDDEHFWETTPAGGRAGAKNELVSGWASFFRMDVTRDFVETDGRGVLAGSGMLA